MIVILRDLFLILGITLALSGCAATEAPRSTPTPTAPPSLNANLWTDYPTLQAGQAQSITVVVLDLNGKPVAGATAILVISAGAYHQNYYFPLTDGEGRARVSVSVPLSGANQTYLIAVTVVDSPTGRWGKAETQFNAIP
jgi:hypothetical protein